MTDYFSLSIQNDMASQTMNRQIKLVFVSRITIQTLFKSFFFICKEKGKKSELFGLFGGREVHDPIIHRHPL